jgi:hypothetical protein
MNCLEVPLGYVSAVAPLTKPIQQSVRYPSFPLVKLASDHTDISGRRFPPPCSSGAKVRREPAEPLFPYASFPNIVEIVVFPPPIPPFALAAPFQLLIFPAGKKLDKPAIVPPEVLAKITSAGENVAGDTTLEVIICTEQKKFSTPERAVSM